MPLTRDFRITIMERAQSDSEFREELLRESLEAMLNGNPQVGKDMLRDLINATIGFDELGKRVNKSPKSIMRMFSTNGNPYSNNLFSVIEAIRQEEGVRLKIAAVRRK